jgi:sec-independent protein translocase protein TatC
MALPNFIADEAVEVLMPLGAHLEELRKRLIWAIGGLVPVLGVSLAFGAEILNFLVQPVEKALVDQGFPGTLVSISPAEAFSTYMKVGLIATVIVGLPWVLFQLWKFVAPGLYPSERRYVYFIVPLSSTLMIGSMVFLYTMVLPIVLAFFVNFGATLGVRNPATADPAPGILFPQAPILGVDPVSPKPGDLWINTELHAIRVCVGEKEGVPEVASIKLTREAGIRPEYRVNEYIDLLQTLTIAFAVGFQTPVFVLLLGWAGFVTPQFLSAYRKHALFITAIVAALLTPGDVSTMFLLWVPLFLLYELGGLLLRLFPSERLARSAKKTPNPEDDNPL